MKNYVKVFEHINMFAAEKTLNEFFRETHNKGHRVLHTAFKIHDSAEYMVVIITLTDEPHPHK